MISAIILAAGESKRMGRPKMLLPWGSTTVLGQVIACFQQAGLEDIVVVTGGARETVEQIVNQYNVRSTFNPRFANDDMLTSLLLGLQAQSPQTQAALVALGDQPQVRPETVRLVCDRFEEHRPKLIVPSYEMRRGHPWLVERSLWDELLNMKFPQSPRDFLNRYQDHIHYVNVDTPTILADLDTPEDYHTSHP